MANGTTGGGPLLSICIPTWNRERYLDVCLQSVLEELRQNPGANVEVVLSDNASTDGTAALCQRFVAAHPVFRYYRNDSNIGGANNLVQVIERAQGTYCWYLGDDDALVPGALGIALDALADERDIYLSWAVETDAAFTPLDHPSYWYLESMTRFTYDLGNDADCLSYISQCRYMAGLFAFISILIFRKRRWLEQADLRETFTRTGYPHMASLLGMTRAACPFRFLPDPLVYKRLSNDPWAVDDAWGRLFSDLKTWGELGREIFQGRDGLKQAFYDVIRRNHPDGIVTNLRNTTDEGRWGLARGWFQELGYPARVVAAVEAGWKLLTQKHTVSPGLDLENLCCTDLGILFRGANKIALCAGGSVGETLIAASLLPHFRARCSGEILWLYPESCRELFAGGPSDCRHLVVDEGRFGNEDAYRREVLAEFRGFRADAILNLSVRRVPILDLILQSSNEAIASLGFLGAQCKTPETTKAMLDRLYTRLVDERGAEGTPLDEMCAIARVAGVSVERPEPQVWLSEDALQEAATWFRLQGWSPDETVVLVPGLLPEDRIYGRYGEALGELCRTRGLKLAVWGSEIETDFCREILRVADCDGQVLAGAISLGGGAAIMSMSRLVVCADSDAAHLACAVNRPHVVLCGGGSFGTIFPYSPLTTVATMPLDCCFCGWGCPHPRMHCVRDVPPALLTRAVEIALETPSNIPHVVVPSMAPTGHEGPTLLDLSGLLDASRCRLVSAELSQTGLENAVHGRSIS